MAKKKAVKKKAVKKKVAKKKTSKKKVSAQLAITRCFVQHPRDHFCVTKIL